jgi:hypothetical protein
MIPVLLSTEYTLVIDTDAFSDHFAKKLCAYCTGFFDEKDNGRDMSDLFYLDEQIEDDESPRGKIAEEKNPFHGFVCQRLDEDSIFSPCCVWLNKRYGYNPEGKYALLTEGNYDEYNFPAPLSVGIFFDEEPRRDHIEKIKQRAIKFFESVWPQLSLRGVPKTSKVNIEGFRLITHTKYGLETEL